MCSWTQAEAEEQAHRERHAPIEAAMFCPACDEPYTAEVFEGEAEGCPTCGGPGVRDL